MVETMRSYVIIGEYSNYKIAPVIDDPVFTRISEHSKDDDSENASFLIDEKSISALIDVLEEIHDGVVT